MMKCSTLANNGYFLKNCKQEISNCYGKTKHATERRKYYMKRIQKCEYLLLFLTFKIT